MSFCSSLYFSMVSVEVASGAALMLPDNRFTSASNVFSELEMSFMAASSLDRTGAGIGIAPARCSG